MAERIASAAKTAVSAAETAVSAAEIAVSGTKMNGYENDGNGNADELNLLCPRV